MFPARVRVSSQHFPVLDCISYSCARKRSWLSLWLGLALDMFQFLNVYRTVHKKDFVFHARVRVRSQYFPVLDCILYSSARTRSWLSLWLWLAVDIFQFWNVYRIVRKKDFVFLARVRVSSQYFPVLDCISYTIKRSWLSLWLGLQYTRRTSCFPLGLWLAVSICQFWIVYHTVAQERDRGSRCG